VVALILIVMAVVMTRQLSIKLRETAARHALRVCQERELTAYLRSIEEKNRKHIVESEAARAETEWTDSMVRQSFRS
jgi:hypothetical protein